MAPHPLVEVDPAALAIAYLVAHDDVRAALGVGLVGGVNRPPYPRVVVSDPPGDDRYLTWLIAPTLQIEAIGDLDGTPGKAALRRLAMTVVGALAEWPSAPAIEGQPVITEVRSIGGLGWMPLPTGQPRYVATLRAWIHPANRTS